MYSERTILRCTWQGFLRRRLIVVPSSVLVIVPVNAAIAHSFTHCFYQSFELNIILAPSVLFPAKRVIAACQPNNKFSLSPPFCLQRRG